MTLGASRHQPVMAIDASVPQDGVTERINRPGHAGAASDGSGMSGAVGWGGRVAGSSLEEVE